MKFLQPDLDTELSFNMSRSGGKGGQHVNKVSTKVELSFDVNGSALLDEQQKSIILQKLQRHINKEGCIKVTAQTARSQLLNKRTAIDKFYQLINSCFEKKKKRVATKPSRAGKEKRIQTKKIRSEKKEGRRRLTDND